MREIILVLAVIFSILAYADSTEETQRQEFTDDLIKWIEACPKGFHLTKEYHTNEVNNGDSRIALVKCTDWKDEQPTIDKATEYQCDKKQEDKLFHERYLSARECELSTGHSYDYCFVVATIKLCKKITK